MVDLVARYYDDNDPRGTRCVAELAYDIERKLIVRKPRGKWSQVHPMAGTTPEAYSDRVAGNFGWRVVYEPHYHAGA